MVGEKGLPEVLKDVIYLVELPPHRLTLTGIKAKTLVWLPISDVIAEVSCKVLAPHRSYCFIAPRLQPGPANGSSAHVVQLVMEFGVWQLEKHGTLTILPFLTFTIFLMVKSGVLDS